MFGPTIFSPISTYALEQDGKKQIFYPKSNDGWLTTLFVLEGRALDKIFVPWIIVSINAVVWTIAAEMWIVAPETVDFSEYETFFGLVLNTSLAFLLVFRLNRSAERFWIARASWGAIIAHARAIVSGIIVHGKHDPINRDGTIRWLASFSVAMMHFIRGIREIVPETLAGVITPAQVKDLASFAHPPLQALDQIRWHMKQVFLVREDASHAVAYQRTQQLDTLEKELNGLMLQMGALERIRATPLPLVYVTHLRTFLIGFLLAMPYIWESSLGYATIPIVTVTAFAMLGLEGAAEEVEAPFLRHRTNHLSMDAYCLLLIGNILQQIKQDADRDLKANGTNQSGVEK